MASGLFVAFLASIMAAMLGGVVGYSSSVVLRVLLPRLAGAIGDWLVLGGIVVGGIGGLLLIGRAMWMDFKRSGVSK